MNKINITCCVVGTSGGGKTRLIHNLICKPYTNSVQFTENHTTYRLCLGNVVLIFDDTIGIGDCEGAFDISNTYEVLKNQIANKYGDFSKYKERLNDIYKQAHVKILLIDLHAFKIDQIENEIIKFFSTVSDLINMNNFNNLMIIFGHTDEIKKKNKKDMDAFMKTCKTITKKYIKEKLEKPGHILHKHICFYDIEKEYGADKIGECDLDIMEKIFEISGNHGYFTSIVREYQKKLDEQYKLRKKEREFLANCNELEKSVKDITPSIYAVDEIKPLRAKLSMIKGELVKNVDETIRNMCLEKVEKMEKDLLHFEDVSNMIVKNFKDYVEKIEDLYHEASGYWFRKKYRIREKYEKLKREGEQFNLHGEEKALVERKFKKIDDL